MGRSPRRIAASSRGSTCWGRVVQGGEGVSVSGGSSVDGSGGDARTGPALPG